MQQTSLPDVLDVPLSNSQECIIPISPDICFGSVTIGGYIPCLAAKYAVHYACQNPRLESQASLRSMSAHFYRPLFAAKGSVRMFLREVSIGKAWSTLRVEVFQPVKGNKIALSADILISGRSISSLTLPTNWAIRPPPPPVDLAKLENHSDPGWICYHTAFKPKGFRRAHSYAKHFISVNWSPDTPFTEQWITPGWDCAPSGSPLESSTADARPRWCTDMVPLIMDLSLPTECSFLSGINGEGDHFASMTAFLRYATAQREARERGDPNWRDLPDDGSERVEGSMGPVALTMNIDIRQSLPEEGTRWLYLRNEVKCIRNGGVSVEATLFNESMELVAVSHQVGQIVSSERKQMKMKTESRL